MSIWLTCWNIESFTSNIEHFGLFNLLLLIRGVYMLLAVGGLRVCKANLCLRRSLLDRSNSSGPEILLCGQKTWELTRKSAN